MAIYQIQIRRGTSSAWTSANPVLAAGEFGLETDTRRIKIGTGSDVWTQLLYVDTGPPQSVASGGIPNLTGPQQLQITTGSVVATPDGRRWVYTGSGPKTSEASYLVIGNLSPIWSDISNKPSTFAPPPASAVTLGGVKVGDNVTVTGDGTISVAAPYVLPPASTASPGGVQLADATAITNGTAGRVVDAAQLKAALALKANISSLATVATTGSYGDLVNQPTEFDGGNF
jgi:hypothetical protein